MTLIVVDHHRITADAYAIEVVNGETNVVDNFPKIFTLKQPLSYTRGDRELSSHNNIAFCGDANTFYDIWSRYVEGHYTSVDDLVRLVCEAEGDVQLVIPFPAAVLTITAQDGLVATEYSEGEIFTFGDAYHGKGHPHETRPWFDIFHDSISGQALPGDSYQSTRHLERDQIRWDQLVTTAKAKRHTRRMPWSRTQKKSH